MDERQFSGRDVGHIDVEVQNQIRDLLDHDPCGVVGAELLAVFELAAAASADLRPGGDFAAASAGMDTKLYRPEASSFALKRDSIDARRTCSALVVGSRSA